ncbi:hypothetical protein HMPREF3213_01724 [Heyndrickxia coagulans]|uniref:Uncharacterized protein n=1 Tax=Heyndrickxia coagulans TaxID=1398 RepID=A0A133KTD4_HEYCO|nr:hypothetical protein HMPREF3213_01724 [Heyndrickxia coagulans]
MICCLKFYQKINGSQYNYFKFFYRIYTNGGIKKKTPHQITLCREFFLSTAWF